jgi:pimeloyl-ACP methyl ester carboxylesterase
MGGGEVARYITRHGQEWLHSVVFAAAVPPYFRTDLPKITLPTLVLHGNAETVAFEGSGRLTHQASSSPGTGTRYEQLWEALSSVTAPVLLARGLRPDSVLDDDDERELRRRLPSAQVVHVEDAGHSLQGDTPLELTAIIEQFVF